MLFSSKLLRLSVRSFLSREKTLETTFLILLFLISIFFRFYNFPHRIGWNNDPGRDFLAGYLISHQAQSTLFGHWNSGIGFVYPPYYYYLIALLSAVNDSPEFISGFFVFLHAASVIVIYFIGIKFYSKLIAGCSAFLYTVSPYMIGVSLYPLSAYFSLIIFLISLFFFASYSKEGKDIFLLLSIALLVFASTIFYGAVLFFPVYGVVVLFKSLQYRKLVKGICLLIFSFLFFFITFFSPLILNGNLSELIGKGMFLSVRVTESVNLQDFLQVSLTEFGRVFPNRTVVAIIFYLVIGIFFTFKKSTPLFLISFLLVFGYHVILLVYKKEPLDHYLIFLAPLFFLTIGSLLQLSLRFKYHLSPIFLVIFFSSLFFIGANDFHQLVTIQQGRKLETYRQLAGVLMKIYPDYGFTLTENWSPTFWHSRSIWFFLRNENRFILSAGDGQIGMESQQTIHLCELRENDKDEFCTDLINQYDWKYLRSIATADGSVRFELYSE